MYDKKWHEMWPFNVLSVILLCIFGLLGILVLGKVIGTILDAFGIHVVY
jgi:hypothetical protein